MVRGLAEPCLAKMSGRAVVVVNVDNVLVWQFSRGEHSRGICLSAAVDPVAVKDLHVPSQWKNDRTLRLELDYNPCGKSFKSVTVLHKSG